MNPKQEAGERLEAAHPIWACDDEAIKREYQAALDEAKRWQDWHSRADSEAERLQIRVEELERYREALLSDEFLGWLADGLEAVGWPLPVDGRKTRDNLHAALAHALAALSGEQGNGA